MNNKMREPVGHGFFLLFQKLHSEKKTFEIASKVWVTFQNLCQKSEAMVPIFTCECVKVVGKWECLSVCWYEYIHRYTHQKNSPDVSRSDLDPEKGWSPPFPPFLINELTFCNTLYSHKAVCSCVVAYLLLLLLQAFVVVSLNLSPYFC